MEKKIYKVLKPIGFSGRRNRGELIHLTDEEARNIGSDYVALEATPATAGDNVEAKDDVHHEKSAKPKTKKSKK